MIKSFDEMLKVDVTPYVEQRDGADYLNWAKCVSLLHDNGADVVYFTPLVNSDGSSLFMSEREFTDKSGNKNKCYEVAVEITIDDLVFVMRAPVMNGANPVKDNSMSQQRVWNAQTRAFVKGVAIRTGLGFSLWADDLDEKVQEDDLSKHSLFKIKERFQQGYTRLLAGGLSTKEIADRMEMTEEDIKVIFTYFGVLDRFEQKMLSL